MNNQREPKLVLAMVGLPARGKSYTAQKLARYLSWLGYSTRLFNLGEMRRATLGAHQPASFFDPLNQEGQAALHALADSALDQLTQWLGRGAGIAVLDGTNSTRARRSWIRQRCAEVGAEVQFIELIHDDPEVIERNIRDTKITSPDYAGMPPEKAAADFRARIAHYERSYETVGDDEGSYVKMVGQGRQLVLSRIDGYVPARIVFFLTNLQISTRPIWLTRHGESRFNPENRIGGDPPLSPLGEAYGRRLGEYVNRHFAPEDGLEVWTSTLQRARQTGGFVTQDTLQWRSLDEIDAGVCDGLTYHEIRERMPAEFAARARDKLRYRYPMGESYQDVIQRLDRVIIELERHRTPVLVVAHQAVLRALYAYFVDLPPERCPHVSIPLHTIIQLTPKAYGCAEERVPLLNG
jgi:broad specificity phosphatase PhoE